MTAPSRHATRPDPSPLLAAAARSLYAPSILDTQPWHWQIAGDDLRLYADVGRHLETTDPDGRLLLLSCGAALHHARITLAATGWDTTVERFPDGDAAEPLARIRLGDAVPPDPQAQRMADAIETRRTDRRAYSARVVPDAVLTRLRRCVEQQGAYLHVVRDDQMPMLAVALARAAEVQRDDPEYQKELRRWTQRPPDSDDGVAATRGTPVSPSEPATALVPGDQVGPNSAAGNDHGATYMVLFGRTAGRTDVLRGGEALSAMLLLATAEGLAAAPLSHAVEVQWTRHLLYGLLSGIGEPFLVIKLGYCDYEEPLPPPPRRDPSEVITVDE